MSSNPQKERKEEMYYGGNRGCFSTQITKLPQGQGMIVMGGVDFNFKKF